MALQASGVGRYCRASPHACHNTVIDGLDRTSGMIALLQRVTEAHVEVEGRQIGAIGPGLLVLACAERGDSESEAERLVERVLGYRVFSDAQGKMNLSLRDVRGGLLLVPQFT